MCSALGTLKTGKAGERPRLCAICLCSETNSEKRRHAVHAPHRTQYSVKWPWRLWRYLKADGMSPPPLDHASTSYSIALRHPSERFAARSTVKGDVGGGLHDARRSCASSKSRPALIDPRMSSMAAKRNADGATGGQRCRSGKD